MLRKLMRWYLRRQTSSYLGSFCEILDLNGKPKFFTVCIEDLGDIVLLRCVHSGFEFSCPKESPYLAITNHKIL